MVVAVDPVRLETGVEAVVAGAGAEPVVVDIPEEPDVPLGVKADNRLNMSTTTLLTSFCSPDVAVFVVGVDAEAGLNPRMTEPSQLHRISFSS